MASQKLAVSYKHCISNAVKTLKCKKKNKIQKYEKNEKHKKNNKKQNQNKYHTLKIFSANADGLGRKQHSLTHQISENKSTVFTIQETNHKTKGKYKNNEYEIFEAIRKNKEKGGTMLGIHKSLEPVLIEEYSDNFELIVTEIKISNKEIRLMTGYGPQEYWIDDEKMPFFVALEEEVSKATTANKSVIIAMDANSKLGPTYIENDPKPMSENGIILSGIMERHALIVANGVKEKCKGVITRKRNTKKGTQESAIDLVIISSDMLEHLVTIKIDEEQEKVLTSITNTKNGTIKHEIDHNSIETEFSIKWQEKPKEQNETIFNFNDEDSKKKFNEMTKNNTKLSSIFETEERVEVQARKFIKALNRILHQCFKKVSIKPKLNTKIDQLFRRQRELKKKTDKESQKELKDVEEDLADKMAEDLYNIVKEEVKLVESDEGGFNSGHLWRLKSKLRKKINNAPTAMNDKNGNLVTTSEGLKKLAMDHFKEVLRNRPIKPELEKYKGEREKLCEERIKIASKNITPDWNEDDVKYVINKLKKKKSRDPLGYSNELVQCGGQDFIAAIVKLMNRIKKKQQLPQCLQPCNITSLFKNKGSRKDFNQYRGVFRVTVFRNILDRLIFNDEYETIEKNLTDSNVGGRKGRNIRDNIFVINAVINSIKKGKEDPCDITVNDVEKCFDSLWVQECINTLFEYGLRNDKLVLLYEESKTAMIAIKTSSGITDRETIENIIMQGTVFGSLICTTVMDKLAKIFYSDENLLYKYKGEVDIPVLGMVDDVLSVAKCSETSVITNATIVSFMELNKLKLAAHKCAKIHIGKKCDNCPELKVHEEVMKESHAEKYLGDVISEDGTLDENIKVRKLKGYSYISEIRALLSDMPFGHRRVEVGLMLRNAMFVNGILCNSEAWHSISKKHIDQFEVMDRSLLKFIIKAHAKVQNEFLYLETGAIPIKEVITSRRLMYLQNILKRPSNELLRKVFQKQKESPVRGDWVELVNKDCEILNFDIDEHKIEHETKTEHKNNVKKKIHKYVFDNLKQQQQGHSKIRDICYEKFKPQEYLKTHMLTNHEVSLLFSLRSRTTKQFKANFPYHQDQQCPMPGCTELDTPEHCLQCEKLFNNTQCSDTQYDDIFSSDISKQVAVTKIFASLLERREDSSASQPVGPDRDLS